MGFRYIIILSFCVFVIGVSVLTDTHTLLSHLFQSKGAERKHRNDAKQIQKLSQQEKVPTLQQPIRTSYFGHVTGYHPFRDQYFLFRSVPAT